MTKFVKTASCKKGHQFSVSDVVAIATDCDTGTKCNIDDLISILNHLGMCANSTDIGEKHFIMVNSEPFENELSALEAGFAVSERRQGRVMTEKVMTEKEQIKNKLDELVRRLEFFNKRYQNVPLQLAKDIRVLVLGEQSCPDRRGEL